MSADTFVRYYALVLGDKFSLDNPSGLFREILADDDYRLEFFSRAGAWETDNELVRFVFGGEPGAHLLTEAQAKEVLRSWGAVLEPPTLRRSTAVIGAEDWDESKSSSPFPPKTQKHRPRRGRGMEQS